MGRVVDVDVLRERVRVYFEGQPPKTFAADDLQPAPQPATPGARLRTMPRFYVTTPIYYVNDVPHLGTFYTTVVADALARYHRARGRENVSSSPASTSTARRSSASRASAGWTRRPTATRSRPSSRRPGSSSASPTTTSSARPQPRHKAAVAEMWARLAGSKGPDGRPDLFEAEYDGMYCVGCEEAKTEDDVVADGDRKLCKIHLTPVERVKEKNYFFRLSAYADTLLAWYETHPGPPRVAPQRGPFLREGRPPRSRRSRARRSSGASRSPAIRRRRSTSGSTRSRTT